MTEDQFDILLNAINEIRDSVESLKGARYDGSHGHDLSDISGEISSVESSIGNVQIAIEELNRNVRKLNR
ncbi:hypothetical protein AQPE_4881 [Aquipluma nitroreducens]|uniref:Uncharacterized protein n=1 Tax=Aquipluma nitroreducens TaxID=2010828 RepID=A0A5K7SGR0_9BACT|nr:hypothetical protein [Aquipluma nitroreducens]BBE20659.1 hypothetical protein AQPE_4853 [Aquipluma nitroreducens]BBE20687.1 hypothetical protein AQPE_4881 [Aquipluma nitroreducens]